MTHGCTLQKIAPYGSDPEHRQLVCKAGEACGHLARRPGAAPGAAPECGGPDVMIALRCVALRCIAQLGWVGLGSHPSHRI